MLQQAHIVLPIRNKLLMFIMQCYQQGNFVESFTNSGQYKILDNMGSQVFKEPLNSNYSTTHSWKFVKISDTNKNLNLALKKTQNFLHKTVIQG